MTRLRPLIAPGLSLFTLFACATSDGPRTTSAAEQPASATPTVIVGTPTCADIGLYGDASSSTPSNAPGILAVGAPVIVPLTSAANATLTCFECGPPNVKPLAVDFWSGIPVDAVIVSANDRDGLVVSNLYAYPTAVTNDTDLVAPRTSFCEADCPELVPVTVSFCFSSTAT